SGRTEGSAGTSARRLRRGRCRRPPARPGAPSCALPARNRSRSRAARRARRFARRGVRAHRARRRRRAALPAGTSRRRPSPRRARATARAGRAVRPPPEASRGRATPASIPNRGRPGRAGARAAGGGARASSRLRGNGKTDRTRLIPGLDSLHGTGARTGVRPAPADPSIPSVAAICVYPNLVPTAKERLRGSGVKVASVATGFPSGQYPTDLKIADARRAVELGADEVDMVIDRGAFLSGRYAKVYDEIVKVKEAVGSAHLKVILETGELGTYDNVRRASLLAMAAGADFIKTSTGKIPSAATLPVALCMLEAIRDVYEETGRAVGFKPAGGV